MRAISLFLLMVCAAQGQWLNWRGPNFNGSAAEGANPPVSWSETENLAWKVDLPGEGSSTPLVVGEKVVVLASEPIDGGAFRFLLCAYDLETGDELWRSVAVEAAPHEGMHQTNTLASWSPVSDGEKVWAYYGSFGVYCFDLEGKKLWSKELEPLTMRNGFGEGNAPGLMGDVLVLTRDHEGQSEVLALDKHSGDEVWRVERDEPSNWGSPLVTEFEERQLVVTTGENFARCYDLATGEEMWRCAGQTMRPVATPCRYGDDVIIASGFRGSYLCSVPLGGEGDMTDKVNYFYDGGTPDIPSPLLSGDRLYFVQGKGGLLSCIDAGTGEQHYFRERIDVSTMYASPLAAGGHVYFQGRDGTTLVIRDGEELEVIGSNEVDDTTDGTPVAVGGSLLLRGRSTLYCFRE